MGTSIIASPNPAALEKERVQNILGEIIDNPEILARIDREDAAREKMTDALAMFKTELEPLTTKLEAGVPIEGECDLGY